jgi:CRISPR/Cas system-associated exonuclease Cas4 (RecB family)
MKSFLEFVAEDIISKYGTNLSRVAVVFPNKRASLFLNGYLAQIVNKPLWSPSYITISELFRQQTSLQVADSIKQVCDLHKSFCLQTDSNETLDHFYGWGQLLLSDFDDIDKNMADADRVFANLRDIHELDDVSYLTDKQRNMIRRFFSTFTDDHDSQLKERFLKLWSRFADIYHDFNKRLAAQGLAYEGALYRRVAESLRDDTCAERFQYDYYLFVGFNLIQPVEQQLFQWLMQQGKARFYWDFDKYYIKNHEAGHYIAQYLEHFPNELDISDDMLYDNFSRKKDIQYISAATENIQARYISNWLREKDGERMKAGRRTAIVLCNEGLLQTVIHCLPPEVSKVNITMGYPLSQTPVASLLQQLINVQTSQYPPRHLRILRRHPYFRYMSDEHLLDSSDNPLTLLTNLADTLQDIGVNAREEVTDALFQESLFRGYTIVNRLKGLVESGDLTVDISTLQRLLTQIIQTSSIPFHGEPAEGLQIMGVLETRNLDFDHVLLLSCNEGNMPRGINDSSFIPHNLRHAYGLTTADNKVAIYAYYFHRLLQRASDITLLYNNSTEDGKTGERSRFMLQMLVESNHPIVQYTLQSGVSANIHQHTAIGKTQHVMRLLSDTFRKQMLTPTAINLYMRCPLQFFYRYAGGLKKPDLPVDEQELDNCTFGDIFHEAADIIYKQLPRQIERPILEALLRNPATIERSVDEAFHKILPDRPQGGLHLINREVIIHYLRQLIEIDMQLAPFTIIGLECDVQRQISIADSQSNIPNSTFNIQLGGRIDRLDQMNDGRIRVVDYKTGSLRLKPLADVDAIFQPENIHNHSDYYLQTFVYADIVSRQMVHGKGQASPNKVSPALLFIQHAGTDNYDPTLYFGKTRIDDVADYSEHFNELLLKKIDEIFSADIDFVPTDDQRICQSCPYALICGK